MLSIVYLMSPASSLERKYFPCNVKTVLFTIPVKFDELIEMILEKVWN